MKEFIKEYWKYFKSEGKKCLDDLKHIKTIYKQVPNLLTIFRLLSTIPINIFFFTGNIAAALITCGVAASTDLVDGQFARKFNCSSQFGADLDAICDKLFIVLMALPIVIQNPFMLLNIGLEAGITITNVNSEKNGQKVSSAMIGKIKTWVLSLTVLLGYLLPLLNIAPTLLSSFLITIPAATFQTATLIKYLKINNNSKVNLSEQEVEATTSIDVPVVATKEEMKKELVKEYVRPATLEELRKERERLLRVDHEKGHQKTKTDLK